MKIEKIQKNNIVFHSLPKLDGNISHEIKPLIKELEQDTFSYGVKISEFNKNFFGEKGILKIEIDGEPYEFVTTIDDEKGLIESLFNKSKNDPNYKGSFAEMVDNIRDTLKGVFVRNGNRDDFIADLHPNFPSLTKNQSLMRYGNKKTVDNEQSRNVCNIMSNFSKNDVSLDDLKTIEYMIKKGKYSNNERRIAYSYYDEVYEVQYYYMPDKNTVRMQNANGYIKNIKIAKD